MKRVANSRIPDYAKRLGILLVMVILIAGIGSCDGASCGGLAEWYLGASGGEGGQVIVSGGPIFADGTVVSIEAVADECYTFVNWTGDVADPYSPITTVTMDQALNVTANFALLRYDLAVGSTDGGQVTSPGEGTFTYDCGTVVPLVATAEDGYYFGNWSGEVETIANINAPTTTITMKGNYSVTANFEEIPPEQFVLTTSSTTGGLVTTPGEGTFLYDEDTVVGLVAVADECYQFVNWTGDVGTIADVYDASTTVTMNGHYSVTANFVMLQYDLTVGSTDGGQVSSPGEGAIAYECGTVVDLVAEADECYQFVNWSGDVSTVADPNSATTTITMDGPMSVTANFALLSYDLATDSTEGGDVVDPGEDTFAYDCGTVVNLVAEAEAGYRFVSWTGDVATIANVTAASTTITMEGNYAVTANFIARHSLTIDSTDDGEVTTPGEGTFIYDAGTVVDLVATPDAYYGFVEWTGDTGTVADITAASTTITMEGNYAITANFCLFAGGNGTAEDPYRITDWWHLDNVRNYLSSHFIVITDLDSNSVGYAELASPTAHEGRGWQPIAVANNTFVGSFDGQGYEICDLFINRPDESEVGLFGAIGEVGVVGNVGVNGNVTGYDNTGGLAGKNSGAISNSFSTCRVIGNYNVGGLVGKNDNSEGTVTDSCATGNVTGANNVGGLVGWNREGTMSKSYATGRVTGDNNVGGLTGKNDDTASDSYATGRVTGNDNVGGLVGRNDNTGNVSNSYSTGSVTGSLHTGGLAGRNSGTVSNSFWDTQTSGQGSSAGGTGKTTAEMMDFDTFSGAGWDIIAVANSSARDTDYIWNIVDGMTYPFLSWQPV